MKTRKDRGQGVKGSRVQGVKGPRGQGCTLEPWNPGTLEPWNFGTLGPCFPLVLTALFSACSLAPAGDTIREGALELSGRQASGRAGGVAVEVNEERARQAWIKRNQNKTFDAYIYKTSGTTKGKAGIALYENMEVWVYEAELGAHLRLKYAPPELDRELKRIYATEVKKLGVARTLPKGDVQPDQTYEVIIIGETAAGDRYGLLGEDIVYVAGAPDIGKTCKIKIIGSGSDIAASSGGHAHYARAH